MNMVEHSTPDRDLRDGREQRERVEALLARYPELTSAEVHEVLLFLRKGPALEIGFLTGNEAIRPQLDRFRADHARDLSIGTRELALVAIIMLILLAVIALLWNAGARH